MVVVSRVRKKIQRVGEDIETLEPHETLVDELREQVCDGHSSEWRVSCFRLLSRPVSGEGLRAHIADVCAVPEPGAEVV